MRMIYKDFNYLERIELWNIRNSQNKIILNFGRVNVKFYSFIF